MIRFIVNKSKIKKKKIMKHLKIFEAIGDTYYYLHVKKIEDGDIYDYLFSDLESVENYYLMVVNDFKEYEDNNIKKYLSYDSINHVNENPILTIRDAESWVDYHSDQYYIYYTSITVEEKFELPEYLKIHIDKEKYNI